MAKDDRDSDNIFGYSMKDRKKLNKLAHFYGVEGIRGQGYDGSETNHMEKPVTGRPGSHGGLSGAKDYRTHEDLGREINDKMANGAMGNYLLFSGKNLPHATDVEGLYELHKDAKKLHKEIGGNNYNNAGSDNFKLAQHAFDEWEAGLESKKPKEEETPEPEKEVPKMMSWNEAVAAGNMSPRIMGAIERQKAREGQNPLGNYPRFFSEVEKATTQTPSITPATKAQDFLKASVDAVTTTPGATQKAKDTEKVYQGMGKGTAALDHLRGMKPQNIYEQTIQDSLSAYSANSLISGML